METLLIYRGQQSLEGRLIDYTGDVPVRSVVSRDAYDFQSYGIAQAWTANGWADIQRFPIDRLAISPKSYVTKDGDWETTMGEDLIALVEYAHNHILHTHTKSVIKIYP